LLEAAVAPLAALAAPFPDCDRPPHVESSLDTEIWRLSYSDALVDEPRHRATVQVGMHFVRLAANLNRVEGTNSAEAFNARVAGNIANDDIIGSMEFACKVAGAKVVVVMGHTSCGAIKGAIDNVQLGNLTGLLARIRPVVSATRYQGERSAKNYDFVDAVARRNVEMTMADIHRRSAVLADLERSGPIKVVGAMYNLESGLVEFFS
jgi:carbonic anhydrase